MIRATFTFDCLQLGDKVKTLYWQEKVFEHHTRDLVYLKVEPAYGPLRDDPRFQSLLRRMNFPEQLTPSKQQY